VQCVGGILIDYSINKRKKTKLNLDREKVSKQVGLWDWVPRPDAVM